MKMVELSGAQSPIVDAGEKGIEGRITGESTLTDRKSVV